MGSWVFDLVDVAGNPLTPGGLFTEGTALSWGRGAPAMYQGLINLDTDAAEAVCSGSNDVDVYVKGYRTPTGGSTEQRVLRFYGSVWVDEVRGSSNQAMITAFDPMALMAKRFTDAQYVPTDMGLLLKAFVDTTNSVDGETGIKTDTALIELSYAIDVDLRQNRPTILSMVEQFVSTLDGPEAWIMPTELAAGKIGNLYASASRGVASDAVFGFGGVTDANCEDMSRVRDLNLVENDVRGYTDENLNANSVDATSVAALRRLIGYTSFTGETSQATLGARTKGRLEERSTKAKIAAYTATPGPRAPRLFDDYNIADTVELDYRKGRVAWNVQQRVETASIRITETGLEVPDSVSFGKVAA